MKLPLYPVPVLLVLVVLLVRAEIRKENRKIYILKPLSTLTVIVMALLSFTEPSFNPVYTAGILAGLLLSLGGDAALMFPENRKAFTAGLGLFLLAHLAYAAVFTAAGRFSLPDLYSGAVLLVMGMGFYFLIRKNLGKMRLPVMVYIVIISLMVNRAVSAALTRPRFLRI